MVGRMPVLGGNAENKGGEREKSVDCGSDVASFRNRQRPILLAGRSAESL